MKSKKKVNIHEMSRNEYLKWLEQDAYERYCSVHWKEMTDTWVADHNSVSPFSPEAGCFHRAYNRAQNRE